MPLKYEDFDKGAIIFDKIESHLISLKHNKKNQGIRFCFDKFPVLALWTFPKKKAPYICLEPWHGLPAMTTDGEVFKDKPYIITLDKNQKFDIGYSVSIIGN
ncbi:MAG: hypothetical protein ACLR3R_19320 [Clostridium paraputrificum]